MLTAGFEVEIWVWFFSGKWSARGTHTTGDIAMPEKLSIQHYITREIEYIWCLDGY